MTSTPSMLYSDVEEGEEEGMVEKIMTSMEKTMSNLEKSIAIDGASLDDHVNRHLNRFYQSLGEIADFDVARMLDLSKDEGRSGQADVDEEEELSLGRRREKEKQERMENIDKTGKEPDFTVRDKFVKSSTSIEELMNVPGFVDKINILGESDSTEMTPLESCLLNAINDDIATTGQEDQEEPDEEQEDEDEKILHSEEFKEFFDVLMDMSKTELKDVFEGEDCFLETDEYRGFCLEIFKKVRDGKIDTCDEMTGPKYVLKPVKDSVVEEPCTDAECDSLWHSLHRKSYYDCVYDNLVGSSKVEPLHRVILVGHMVPNKPQEVRKNHIGVIEDVQSNILDGNITGALIIFQNFYLHCIESTAEALEAVILAMVELVKKKSLLYNVKVVETVYEIPNRYFDYWGSVCIKRKELPSEEVETTSDDSELSRRIREFRDRINVLASYILETVKAGDFETKMQLLMPIDVLPEERELKYFVVNNFFLSVEQYKERYLGQPLFVSSAEEERPPTKKYELCT